jgi:hypothetical protein
MMKKKETKIKMLKIQQPRLKSRISKMKAKMIKKGKRMMNILMKKRCLTLQKDALSEWPKLL